MSLFNDAVADLDARDAATGPVLVVATLSMLFVILSLDVGLTLLALGLVFADAFVLLIVPAAPLVPILPVLLDFFALLKSPLEELLEVGSGSDVVESVL